MKFSKLILIAATLFASLSTAYAGITTQSDIQVVPGRSYVGVIVGTEYDPQAHTITILTDHDAKDTDYANVSGLVFTFDENDLAYGLSLSTAVGKKIAVDIDGSVVTSKGRNIHRASIVTDEFWYGSDKKALVK